MTHPSAGATGRPATHPAEPTHGCVRCGAPVPLDVSMCERCNPLGLSQPATTQVHGTVFLALVVALVILAVAGRSALSGVGPFEARVMEVLPVASGLAVTIELKNDGTKAGATTCRLTRTVNRGVGASAIVQSPQVGGGQRLSFTATTGQLGADAAPLTIECQNP